MITFDPFHVSKSGKHTPGTAWFWSGCAGRETYGLEFSGIGAVDLSNKNALHLLALQTVKLDKSKSLLEFYAEQIINNAEQLLSISKLIAADAYFSKVTFVDPIVEAGFTPITRMRKDSVMRYLYHGPKRKGRGRKKKYDGNIDPKNLKDDQFTVCAKDENGKWIVYEAVVNIQSWKREVKLVVEHSLDIEGNIKNYKLYVSTDTDFDGGELKLAYNLRFQTEFLFRDAKQHSGLNHCQARSVEKLHFHINTSLTLVSLAKVAHHFCLPQTEKKTFSLADIKNEYANDFLFDRIISAFGFYANSNKIKRIRQVIKQWGKIAA